MTKTTSLASNLFGKIFLFSYTFSRSHDSRVYVTETDPDFIPGNSCQLEINPQTYLGKVSCFYNNNIIIFCIENVFN